MECARAFRAWERERGGGGRLPLICFSANVLNEHRLESERAGMDAFITKPLSAEDLAALRRRAQVQADAELAAREVAVH